MLQHFLSIGAGVLLTFWATVAQQYPLFQTTPSQPTPQIVIETAGTGITPNPSPFDIIAAEIARKASSTPTKATTTKPVPVTAGPVQPTTPSIPFTPLPLPTPPVVTPPVTPTPVTPTVPSTPTVPQVDAQISDEALLKGSIVNVICLPGGGLRGSSGSGVVIDSRGLILTVAHIGQGFLLRDYPTPNAGTCYIRTGSPAKNAYAADLVYISPSWLEENEATFLVSNPKGTGEHDFAILAITGSISGKPLPSRFSFIPLTPAGTRVEEGDRVGTGSYAAEFLSSSEIRSSLYPTIKFADVDDVFTFSRNSVDIFSVAAGSAAQEGSSGGVVINEDDRVIGLITTRTVKADLSQRTLQALTMDHIRKSFRNDMGSDLDSYLKGNVSSLITSFEPKAEELLENLKEAINDARN